MNTRWMTATLTLIVLAACGGSDAEEIDTGAVPVAVRSAPVTSGVLARPIVAAGTVAPKDEISLSFKVAGVIQRIAVDPGDVVRAGQVLATLDLREIGAGLTKARSAAEKAERDLARARRLYADSVVTLAQLQDAETAAEVAGADLQAASFNRRYAVIVAPSDGVILRRSAEPGETVSPGTTVLALGSRARGSIVEVGLADRDAVIVREGDRAVVRFDALPDMELQGWVSQIAAAADAATGTYAVEISLTDAERLSAGLVGQVEIRPSRGVPTTIVPIEAILEADGNHATVYALSADRARAERRRVTVAFIDGNRVAVARGLEGVTDVLTDGAAYVDEGAVVRVTP
jgi:membrane fusion protein, multidrug efflux system